MIVRETGSKNKRLGERERCWERKKKGLVQRVRETETEGETSRERLGKRHRE